MAYNKYDKLEWTLIFTSEFGKRFGLSLKQAFNYLSRYQGIAFVMEQALSIVLNSDTYQRLLEDNTTLYYQSPRYVFSFLQTELQTGKVG